MILTLAFRHFWAKKRRSAFLLFGFALGVGVMIVLLSVGEAMLDQSRDVALVGGGEVTVLPQGIDVEAMRTGGVSGMFFGIDHARFLSRQLLGGPRQAGVVRAVAPAIEGKIVYLARGRTTVAVRAGGEIPSRAAAVGTGLDILTGRWRDTPADSAWIAPNPGQLYDELDRFHVPPRPDSTWAEWDYFNVVVGPEEWWYITLLVAGEVSRGRWGGQVLLTRRRPDGRYERFVARVSAGRVTFDTAAAELTVGESTVRQSGGVYRIAARAAGDAGEARVDLELRPRANRYFPPVELREEQLLSGYAVPALVGDASGTLCVAAGCRRIEDAPAYHDHNWGVWRGVTWEWGAARGGALALLYGGVSTPHSDRAGAPFFLTLVDSLGVRQLLRFKAIRYSGSRPVRHSPGVVAPERLEIVAAREADTLRLGVEVEDALASRHEAEGLRRHFLQMRGRFTLAGRIAGAAVADSGAGFFETYVP
ncbi:MAG TPA: hypothetical protein VE091_07625 [Gemmatimonadales bacterium]|nr:hypothetical protein [Gemmatimonadales bacterium]